MATNYPTTIDNYTNPNPTDSQATPTTHSAHHGNAYDAIEAIEAYVGTRSIPGTESLSSVMASIMSRGILSWRNDINYTIGASVMGSDNMYYQAVQASGPASTPRDPVSNPAHWGRPINFRATPILVNSIATLKNVTGMLTGDLALTTGYYPNLIGGQGAYTYDLASTKPDNGGTVIAPTSGVGRWLLLTRSNTVHIRLFGAKGDWDPVADTGTDDTQAFKNIIDYLAGLRIPGGTIDVHGCSIRLTEKIDIWQRFATVLGITTADNYLPVGGEPVRGLFLGIKGDGYQSRIKADLPVATTGALFTWGRFVSLSDKRAMSLVVDGVDFEGPGTRGGHTSEVIIPGPGGFSTITTAPEGAATNAKLTCILMDEVVPVATIRNCRFRGFYKAAQARFGFGISFLGNDTQWCVMGFHASDGVTNVHIDDENEIEFCAIGVYVSETAYDIKIGNNVIEANGAGCDILLNVGKFVRIFHNSFEGSPQNIVMRNSSTAETSQTRHISVYGNTGVNYDLNGGLIDFKSEGNAHNTLGEVFAVNTGQAFRDIQFIDDTFDEGPIDLSTFTLSGIASWSAIEFSGRTVGGADANFSARTPKIKQGFVSTSSVTPVKAFGLTVTNATTSARIEIAGYKTAGPAADMRMQTQKYIGVLERVAGSGCIVEFSATESFTTNYNTTGTNVPVTVAVPTVTITGAGTATQTVAIEFATGTAVSGTASNFWEARILNETDGVQFE